MSEPKIMSRADAIEALRFPALLDNALRAGWLKPVGSIGSNRPCTAIYAARDVETVVARVLSGDIPPNPQVKQKEARP